MIFRLRVLKGVEWDGNEEFVIRARTESQARKLANSKSLCEGKIWEDPKQASCEQVKASGEPEIVVQSTRWG